ncbi:MAG: sensor domain-containing diguanylate cyclase [Candidatus Omnitrophota bacterium]
MKKQNPVQKNRLIPESNNHSERTPNDKWALFDLFLEISTQMSSFVSTDQLITFFVNRIAEIFKAERVSLMLLDDTAEELYIKASCGLNPSGNNAKIKLGQMFGGWVAKQCKPLLVKNIAAEFPDLLKGRLLRYKSKSFIIAPITINLIRNKISNGQAKQGVIGIISLTDKKDLTAFTDEDLKIINFLCHYLALRIEDIKLLEKNAELVTIDILTGLFNHRYFQEQLFEEIYHAERYRHPLSLLMLDIDNFAQHNQAYGYSAGDSALKQIGRIIKDNTRRVDVAVRYGPEEFMVILPNARLKQAIIVGERIRETINYSVFTEKRTSSLAMARLTVSIGLVEYKIGLVKEELIQRVASALLEAKQKGKNRLSVFK